MTRRRTRGSGGGRQRCAGVACAVPLALALLAGCTWTALREYERRSAQENAEYRVTTGDCEQALLSIERAQAASDLGEYAARSSWLKAQCLGQLERREESMAHLRLLRDFYGGLPADLSIEVGEREELESEPKDRDTRAAHVADIEVPNPRYSRDAERSGIAGVVVVAFFVNPDGGIERIRVLDAPHPLLASWAIEAVAHAKSAPTVPADASTQFGAVFRFERRWPPPRDAQQGAPAQTGH